MRINNNQIHLSVTELSRLGTKSKLFAFSGPSVKRAAMGRQAQQIYQAKVLKGIKNYETEISLFFRDLLAGYEIYLGGRLDGQYRKNNSLIIDEIKTVTLAPKEFAKLEEETFGAHRNQLAIYQWLTAIDNPGIKIVSRLIYINLINNEIRVLPLEADNTACEKIYLEQVGKILSYLEKNKAHMQQRRLTAELIQWPFPQKRETQEQMMDAISATLNTARQLIINAPTGIGKTAGALFPAISYSLKNDKKLLFLTSKNTQQLLALNTISQMIPKQSGIVTLHLRAARKMCANDHYFCHELVCPFAKNFQEKLSENGIIEKLLTNEFIQPDMIFDISQKAEVCPSEVMFMLVPKADIIVGDFNYAFDPKASLKQIFQEDYDDYIAIIDEAHNLFPRIQQTYSPKIKRSEIENLKEYCRDHKGNIFGEWENWLYKLTDHFDQLTFRGELEYANQAHYMPDINFDDWEKLSDDLDDIFIQYFLYKVRKSVLLDEDPLENFYFEFSFFISVLKLGGKEFYNIFEADKGGNFQIYCADTAEILSRKMIGFHSVVGMSATMKPFEFFSRLSGFDANRSANLNLSSPFPRKNLKVFVNKDVSTKYGQRQKFVLKIADFIEEAVSVHPANYILFFPSFEFLELCWPFVRIPLFRKIRQPRISSDEERKGILDKMSEGEPTLLFAVMGGIFSEGVDFPGDLAEGAFIISPGLPTFDYYRELQRHYYDINYESGREYSYIYPGMAKVVQSAGRIIRTENDKGTIFLVGERFVKSLYQDLFPESWFPLTLKGTKRAFKKELKKFWEKSN